VESLERLRDLGPTRREGDVMRTVGAWPSSGKKAGGRVDTPDQDVVDEIGEALGIPQALGPRAQRLRSCRIGSDTPRTWSGRLAAKRVDLTTESRWQRPGLP
jgi:hypothetical protein